MRTIRTLFALIMAIALISACAPAQAPSNPNALRITAGSEMKSIMFEADGKTPTRLYRDLKAAAGDVEFTFKGSVDIKMELVALSGKPSNSMDVYIPASTLQLPGNTTSYPSVVKTVVGLMVSKDAAAALGWNPATGISINQLVEALRNDQIHLAMTNASQSNSGQTFYIAALTALCGQEVLTADCLSRPEVVDGITTILNGIDKTAESTGFLADKYVEDKLNGTNAWNAMVTYEATAIQANQKLGNNAELFFYISGATAVADEPIVFTGTPDKKDAYDKFLAFMQSAEAQDQMASMGWRVSSKTVLGIAMPGADARIWNPDYGFDATTEFTTMTFPRAEVTAQAVNMYQTAFRKPSFTIYVLDFSGSMDNNGGRAQLVDAMDLLLDQNRAAGVSLQAGPRDVTVVYVFWGECHQLGRVDGNDYTQLKNLSNAIAGQGTGSSTGMFSCIEQAMNYAKDNYSADYSWAILPMTDGGSNTGMSAGSFPGFYTQFVRDNNITLPIYGIAFGAPDEGQLDVFKSDKVGGWWYDGRNDLVSAFRKAKGNN